MQSFSYWPNPTGTEQCKSFYLSQWALDPPVNCTSLAQARSGNMIKASPDIFVIGKGEPGVTLLVQNKLYLDLQEVSYWECSANLCSFN